MLNVIKWEYFQQKSLMVSSTAVTYSRVGLHSVGTSINTGDDGRRNIICRKHESPSLLGVVFFNTNWSSFVRYFVNNKPMIKFTHSANHTEHNSNY